VRAIDVILFALLLAGNALALRIWAWLFGTPVVQLCNWYRRLKAHTNLQRKRET
jgi:hypothetical protein